MTNFKSYKHYKESGSRFIGKVPFDWEIKKLKLCLDINEGGIWTDLDDEGFYAIRSTEVNIDGTWNDNEPARIKLTRNELKRNRIRKDDLLVVKSSGSLQHIGKTAIASKRIEEKMCVPSNFMQKLRINNNYNPKYIYYFLNSSVGKDQIGFLSSTTTGLRNITKGTLDNIVVSLPNLIEQDTIVKFLDIKYEEIENVINSKKQQIETLQKYRQSLIIEAVTHGLNHDAEMKDSGIEWIGKIPEHWKLKKLKQLTEVLTCGYASTPEYTDEGIPFLSAQNVKNNKLNLENYNYIPESLHKRLTKNKRVKKGDILQVRVGATIGNSCIVDVDFEFSIYVSLSHIRCTDEIHNEFLNYILNSEIFKLIALSETYQGGGVGNFNVNNLEKIKIAYPSLEEQKLISDYLNEKTSEIDQVIALIQSQVQTLQKYRQSLNYEAITGKIDLQNYFADELEVKI